MSYISIKKNSAYHSRFQVKWRRRRNGKTDYYSRKRLLHQDKRKFNTPKYRLVIRKSKTKFVVQYTFSKLEGDVILHSITPLTLKAYRIDYSLTSFSAAYTSGAMLSKLMINGISNENHQSIIKKKNKVIVSSGTKKFDQIKNLSSSESMLPKANLDIGLSKVTTGGKIFATLKGAIDAGMYIPYNEKRFPGYNSDDGFSPELLDQRINGEHVIEYMKLLKDEDEERFSMQFSKILKKIKTLEFYADSFIKLNKICCYR